MSRTRSIFLSVVTGCLLSANTTGQPAYDYDAPFLATSQLGFMTNSTKEIAFFPGDQADRFPDEIPFYITEVGMRIPRKTSELPLWEQTIFRWPFDIDQGEYLPFDESGKPYVYRGMLYKKQTRWGVIWQGSFSDLEEEGIYQAENEYGFTVPFLVNDRVYDRLDRSYLEMIDAQRSGVEIPGVRPEENADDGRFMSDSTYYLPVAGGWNDAGDWRKWLSLTLGNLEALANIMKNGHPGFYNQARQAMLWGNDYFHNMVSDSGFVYEDTGGGFNRAAGLDEGWWNENHPGVNAGNDTGADNIPMNGNERRVRDRYNPLVQFKFVRYQALCSSVMDGPHKSNCLVLASRAWNYGQRRGHDGRTIFVAEELLAAAELLDAGSTQVGTSKVKALIRTLLDRQETNETGLSGYFTEKDGTDGYRSIAFPVEPPLALLRILELDHPELQELHPDIEKALVEYTDRYMLKDARSNPFGIPPYGVYFNPQYPELQTYRDAGNGRYVRTFIHVYHNRPLPHGVNANFLGQAYFVARADHYFERDDWRDFAERVLQWSTGYNTAGLCLFTGIGFKHPVPANFVNYRVPSGSPVGFLGRPDDTPYLETSNAVEWSTQEIWDVPFYYTIGLINYLRMENK